MILFAVVVVLIPYICPISPVTGIETATTPPWEPAVEEAAAPAVRIVGGEITSIKKYPFIVCVRRAHPSHAHKPLNLSPFKGIGTVPHRADMRNFSDVKERGSNTRCIMQDRGRFIKLSKLTRRDISRFNSEQRENSYIFFNAPFGGVRLFQFLTSSLKQYDMTMK